MVAICQFVCIDPSTIRAVSLFACHMSSAGVKEIYCSLESDHYTSLLIIS